MNIAASCHNVDTTPLESLPGNVDLKQVECINYPAEKRDDSFTQEPHRQCESDKNNSTNSITTRNRNNSTRISSGNYKKQQTNLHKSIDLLTPFSLYRRCLKYTKLRNGHR